MKVIFILIIPILIFAKNIDIFILHSYSSEYPWTKKQNDSFINYLKSFSYEFDFKVEYLDTKRIQFNENYQKKFLNYLKFKYKEFKPTVIYSTDDNALSFLLNNIYEIFPNTPIFFSGVNNSNIKIDKKFVTGVFEKKDIETNLKLAQKLKPNLSEILIIGDNSSTYQVIKKDILKEIKNFPNLKIKFLENREIDKITSSITNNDFMLLTTIGSFVDKNFHPLSLAKVLTTLTKNSNIVIAMEDVYIQMGVLGGYVTSGEEQGENAGWLLMNFLNGKKISELKPIQSPNEYIFNEIELIKHKLSLPIAISESAKIINKQPTFYEEYKNFILITIFILILLLFISISIFAYITHKKNLIIKSSEQKFKDMFEKHSAVMFLINPDETKIIDANSSAEKFYGYTKEELKGMDLSKINISSKEYIKEQEEKVKRYKQNYFIFKHKLASGTLRDVEIHSTPIVVNDKKILFSIIHDITEAREYEINLEKRVKNEIEKRREQEGLLIQQSKLASMGEMISNIAHQWRQPLNAIGLIIQKFKINYQRGKLNEEFLNNNVIKAMNLINKMSTTIDDFRDFYKPNKLKEKFSINESIKEAYILLEASFKHNSITIELNLKEEVYINGYPNELSQVILNILNNAKDALIENSIENKKISIETSIVNGLLYIKISDNATGIKDEIIDRIFEPYFSTKDEGKGTGIGLYMSKIIIENSMHGKISVKNIKNGAEFIITLPLN